jgi:flagella basal body P-ring formation protein FlgA
MKIRPSQLLLCAVVLLIAVPVGGMLAISLLGQGTNGNPDLIARRDLDAGHRIDIGADFTALQGGDSPLRQDEVQGARLKRPVRAGQILKPEDLERK